jgi:hypothetical protein
MIIIDLEKQLPNLLRLCYGSPAFGGMSGESAAYVR